MGDSLLLLTATGHVVSAAIMFIAGLLVFVNSPRKILHGLFFGSLALASVTLLVIGIGITLDPSPLAYAVWMGNIVNVFIVSVYFHFSCVVAGVEHEAKRWIKWIYGIAATIFTLSVTFPHLYLPEVVPKLFTRSFLEPGPLYNVMLIFWITTCLMMAFVLIKAYVKQPNKRPQFEYLFLSSILGFGFGSLDFFLVYDVFAISPLYGMFTGLYIIPLAYGVLAREVTDLWTVANRTFGYSVIIALITALLTILSLLNNILLLWIPWLPFWFIPAVVASIAFLVVRLSWLKSVENERLKYEFLTTAAHKLRTPLTHINLGMQTLSAKLDGDPESRKVLRQIQHSTSQLIELTNILFDTTALKTRDFSYTIEEVDLHRITKETITDLTGVIESKNLKVEIHVEEDIFNVMSDARRITSVLRVLIENAVNYTPEGGLIQIVMNKRDRKAFYTVHDSGIGIAKEDLSLIFRQFFRTKEARKVDVEGVGLGLAMAKSLIERQGGTISAQSRGLGMGSTFQFTLPLDKK